MAALAILQLILPLWRMFIYLKSSVYGYGTTYAVRIPCGQGTGERRREEKALPFDRLTDKMRM
jgi:hypothetical protein